MSDVIGEMVNRFLSWPLPDDVCADAVACQQGAPHRTGTNLLTAAQARQMIEHVCAAALAAKDAEIAEMEARKDAAYLERNQCVSLIATMAHALGHWAGTARTAIDGWSEDWHGCVYIDLPAGQVSWHYHDSQAYLFAHLPPYCGEWDGHDTPEKYRRVLQRPVSNARAERAEANAANWEEQANDRVSDWDEVRAERDALKLRLAAVEDMNAACNADFSRLRAERDALRAAIETAPHAPHCLGGAALGRPSAYPCDCWKRDALAQEGEG